MSNQFADVTEQILACICSFQPITANEIGRLTGWSREDVDLALDVLLRRNAITSLGIDEQSREPLYCTPQSIEHVTT